MKKNFALRAVRPLPQLATSALEAVRRGQVSATVNSPLHGDVVIGLREEQGQPHWFAEKPDGTPVPAAVDERVLPNGFTISLVEHRNLKPGRPPAQLGEQPPPPGEKEFCPFKCGDQSDSFGIMQRPTLAHHACSSGQRYAFIPNAVPFAAHGHCVVVGTTQEEDDYPHVGQTLSASMIADMLEMAEQLPAWFFLFNALHAGASVHHRHFQCALFPNEQLAVERAEVTRRGGRNILAGYPAAALVFPFEGDRASAAACIWECVSRLQGAQTSLNLICIRGRAFLFARDLNHEVVEENPGGVLAACELAGHFIVGSREVFGSLSTDLIASAFGKTTLPLDRLLELTHDGR